MLDIAMPMHQGRVLPQFRLREIDLPQIRGWEVNGSYYVVMKVKMIGKRDQRDSEAPEDAQKLEGDFEMLSIKPLDNKPVDAKQLERQDFEETIARARSGQ